MPLIRSRHIPQRVQAPVALATAVEAFLLAATR